MTQNPRPAPGTIFTFRWGGETWRAIEFDGRVHLSRTCHYCVWTATDFHTLHTVETSVTWGRVDRRDARIKRLRDIGEVEEAARIERLAGRVL